MIRRPPRSTRTDTLFPYTTLFRSPPWSSIRKLQHAVDRPENDDNNDELKEWLAILMAPGSPLGGSRPKAHILAQNNELQIAKFPSKNDTFDKGAWEYLA